MRGEPGEWREGAILGAMRLEELDRYVRENGTQGKQTYSWNKGKDGRVKVRDT